ncbi:hypothetical protein ABZ312_26540 [Streptomyces sp. NPDC006207]|nr:hypothetical protein [Streptomyces sp. PA03-5A]
MRFLRVGPAGFERPTALGAEGAAYGHEMELSVVISRTARCLGSPDAAAGVIAGRAIADVVSESSFRHERAGRGPRMRLWGGGVEVTIDRLGRQRHVLGQT